jgi:glycosyltransferase involved in cell wall biosynthesis
VTEAAAPFSLLLPVYRGDSAAHFAKAFSSSVGEQTRPPAEVVVVRDGPVRSDLSRALAESVAASPVPVRVLALEENVGLARALTRGLRECAHDIVARMDADDISLPTRFEAQLPLLESGRDLVGTGMYEFDQVSRIVGRRTPPVDEDEIRAVARFRDPFNHPTVVYRRSAVLAAGGYRDLRLMEDYWLFARMIQAGARVANVPDPLLMYRVDGGSYARRGGTELFRSEVALQRRFRRDGFTSRGQMARNLLIRGGYRFVPLRLRKAVYRRALVTGPDQADG